MNWRVAFIVSTALDRNRASLSSLASVTETRDLLKTRQVLLKIKQVSPHRVQEGPCLRSRGMSASACLAPPWCPCAR